MGRKRVLISTLVPDNGGVLQMTQFVAECLDERGFEPVLAYYEPYSKSPDLSVPSFKLLQRSTGTRQSILLNNYEGHAIGAWLPEFEFTHFLPTKHWKDLMQSCNFYIAVSGNFLACMPFALTGRNFIAWIATPWHEDRKDRVAQFPWYRKVVDKAIISNIMPAVEKNILKRGTILPISQYTKHQLNTIVGRDVACDILPMPIDTDLFVPDQRRTVPGRIAFVGRFSDPRKNIALLFDAVKTCRDLGENVTAFVIGEDPNQAITENIKSFGLTDYIQCIPYMQRNHLPAILQTIDVFVIPSYQEGLCIAALEAMACGCPIVSTRCGGPEEFVKDAQTGYLVDFDAGAMAKTIVKIIGNRKARKALSEASRSHVETLYNIAIAKEKFWSAFLKIVH